MFRLLVILRRFGQEGAVANAREELFDAHLRAVTADAVARRVQAGDAARARSPRFVAPATAQAA